MRIRLSGTVAEVEQGVDLIRDVFDVHSVSPRYSSRNQVGGVRVYIDATLYDQNAREYDPSSPRCPWCRLAHIVDFHGRAGGWGTWACRRCERMYAMRGEQVQPIVLVDAVQVRAGDYALIPTASGWQHVAADAVPDSNSGLVRIPTELPGRAYLTSDQIRVLRVEQLPNTKENQ